MPAPLRFRTAGASLDNLIYVVGGVTNQTDCHDLALATVQAYDPTIDTWSERPSMPTPRTQVGVGVDSTNHLLYAIGGATAAPGYYALDTVEVYDPATDSWTTKQHMNTRRGAPAIAALHGKIYAIAGQDHGGEVIDTVEEFDPDANGGFGAWTTKPSRMPHPRQQSAAAVIDDKVYIIGGWIPGVGYTSGVDVYTPALDQWTTEAPLPTARSWLGAAVVDDTIYAVGGGAVVARVGEPFTYQITATNNPKSYDAFPLPDGLSIDRQRGIVFGVPTTPSATGFLTTFVATNESGSGSRQVSLSIADSPPLLELEKIVSGTCMTGRAGQPFKFQVIASNIGSEVDFAATGLPYSAGKGPELTIDPVTGLISGTVTPKPDPTAQSFGIGLGLLDLDSAQSYLQLTFVSDPLLPVITSATAVPLVLSKFFSYTITADAPATSFDYLGLNGVLNGTLPNGLTFDPVTHTISGIYTGGDVEAGDPTAPGGSAAGPDTIKKEPPPRRLQLLVRREPNGTGTAPLNFLESLHDLEAEQLPVDTSGGARYTILRGDQRMSRSSAGIFQAAKEGDYVAYSVPVSQPGTYDVRVGIGTSKMGGLVQLAIDGKSQGQIQETYSRAVRHDVRDLGPVSFAQAGNNMFQFAVTKDARNGGGREFVCDYIDLVPFFEAESLAVAKHTAPYTTIHDASFSGGAATLFQAGRVGDYLTYNVPIPRPGTYDIKNQHGHRGNDRCLSTLRGWREARISTGAGESGRGRIYSCAGFRNSDVCYCWE